MTIIHNNKQNIDKQLLEDLFDNPYKISNPSLVEEIDPAMDSIYAWVQETAQSTPKLERLLVTLGGHRYAR